MDYDNGAIDPETKDWIYVPESNTIVHRSEELTLKIELIPGEERGSELGIEIHDISISDPATNEFPLYDEY